MKPFNLQEALAGKPVKLRDGRKAYVRHHETELPVEENECLMGCLLSGDWMTWCENGDYYNGGIPQNPDIIGMYPETKVINGFEVPEPEAEPLIYGTMYFVPLPTDIEFYDVGHWTGSDFDLRTLKRGLVFLNEEDAIATAKAMLGIDPNTGEESCNHLICKKHLQVKL